MPVMTQHHLVDAVTDLQAFPGALVSAVEIMGWCNERPTAVDYGQGDTPAYKHFWNADLDEARSEHRLLKFKTSRARNARNYWALADHAAIAREQVAERGWVEVPWDPHGLRGMGNWDWQNADEP